MPTTLRRRDSARAPAGFGLRAIGAAVLVLGLLAAGCDELSSSGGPPSNLARLKAAQAKAAPQVVQASVASSRIPTPQPAVEPIDTSQAANSPAAAAAPPGGVSHCPPHLGQPPAPSAPSGADIGANPD